MPKIRLFRGCDWVASDLMNMPWNQTKRAVVAMIRNGGPISRIQLAAKLRLTKAAMTQVVQDLLDEGVLIAGGQVSTSMRGRRQELLKIGQGGVYAIGLSIAVDYLVELVLVDIANRVIARKPLPNKPPTEYENPVQYARMIAREISRLEAKVKDGWIADVGVSFSGSLSADGQWIERTNDFRTAQDANDFMAELRRQVKYPVTLMPGVGTAVLAERWLDAKLPPAPNILYVSDRLGFSLILEGKLNLGTAAHPHWLGHFQVDPNGPKCFCGRRGCLAAVSSLFAITDKMAGYEVGQRPLVTAVTSQKEILALGRRYMQGDTTVRKMAAVSFQHLGLAIRSLASMFCLDLIVLGAWAGVTPDEELDRIRKILAEGYYGDKSSPMPVPTIRWCTQGQYQEAYGAAILSIERALETTSNRSL